MQNYNKKRRSAVYYVPIYTIDKLNIKIGDTIRYKEKYEKDDNYKIGIISNIMYNIRNRGDEFIIYVNNDSSIVFDISSIEKI